MVSTIVLSSVTGNKYTLYTMKVGPGTLCIWKIGDVQRINYILSSEYEVHKKVRADARKQHNTASGSKLQHLKYKK